MQKSNLLQEKPTGIPPCQYFHVNLWYSSEPAARKFAIHLCKNECPVLDWCEKLSDEQEAGLNEPKQLDGIWAGQTPTERLRRRRGFKF